MKRKLPFLFLLFCCVQNVVAQSLNPNLTTHTTFSFINNFNAYNQQQLPTVKTFTFNEDALYIKDSADKSMQWHLYIDYGFRYIKDSLFEKTSDVISFDWLNEKTEVAEHTKFSFALNVNTQISPTKQLEYNDDFSAQQKKVVANFMSPGQITFATGFTHTFLKNIKLSVNPVAISVNTFFNQQAYDNLQTDLINDVAKNKNVSFVFLNTLQLNLLRKYHLIAKDAKMKDLTWQLNSTFLYAETDNSFTWRGLNSFTLKVFKSITIGLQSQWLLSKKQNQITNKENTKLNYGYRIQLGVQL